MRCHEHSAQHTRPLSHVTHVTSTSGVQSQSAHVHRNPGTCKAGNLSSIPRGWMSQADRTRFELELEFVQLLALPAYVQWLAQQGYLDSDPFKAYLRYLLYWRDPAYARHLLYPSALTVLELLVCSREFRAAALQPGFVAYVQAQLARASQPSTLA